MSTHAAQASSSPNRIKSVLDVVRFQATILIGATGAPTIPKNSDPGITISRSATGAYSLTFPKGQNVWITITLQSPAKTVVTSVLTTSDAYTGTAAFKTLAGTNAAADTDPANGDRIFITFEVER